MSIKSAFDNFMSSGEFESSVDLSTKTLWSGGYYYYVLELFDGGDYRVLASNQIGDLYKTPGLFLRIPSLNTEDWNDDPSIRSYENARKYIQDDFAEKLKIA